MSVKEQVLHDIDALGEDELRKLARYLERLRSRPYRPASSDSSDELAALYAEFAEEDRLLAEQGMADYREQLNAEDTL